MEILTVKYDVVLNDYMGRTRLVMLEQMMAILTILKK